MSRLQLVVVLGDINRRQAQGIEIRADTTLTLTGGKGKMTKDDLMKFCATGRGHINISVPWSDGEYSYATNGHVIIRVPRLGDVHEKDTAPQTKQLFPYPDPPAWFALAEIKLPKTKTVDCSECDGEGEVEHKECSSCRGHYCEECNGTGKVIPRRPVPVGNSHYQYGYLLMLMELPNCKIGPDVDPMKQTPFQFDGGDGLIMPMRHIVGTWEAI